MKKYLFFLGACIVTSIAFMALVLGSCSTEEGANGILFWSNSSQAPVFLGCKAVAEDEIEFTFSKPVKVKSINFNPELAIVSSDTADHDDRIVRVKLEEKLPPGILLTADILAEDDKRNTINVLVPFRSRNNRMPKLEINEFRTEYSRSVSAARTTYRVEFAELKIKTAGNFGGMRVVMAGGSQKPTVYTFAPVEVRAGDYVALHFRKMEDACKDEYGRLDESGGTEAVPTAREFWIPGTDKLINKTGFIYVLDQDDEVLSAVMFSETPDVLWKKDYLAEAAEFLHQKGAWTNASGGICSPADSIITIGTTATRTICRDETKPNTNTAADWYITVTSGQTPGRTNNTGRYAP